MPQKIRLNVDYRRLRAAQYAPTGDALDAIMKGFRALMDQGVELPPATRAWVEACEGVKRTIKKG